MNGLLEDLVDLALAATWAGVAFVAVLAIAVYWRHVVRGPRACWSCGERRDSRWMLACGACRHVAREMRYAARILAEYELEVMPARLEIALRAKGKNDGNAA